MRTAPFAITVVVCHFPASGPPTVAEAAMTSIESNKMDYRGNY